MGRSKVNLLTKLLISYLLVLLFPVMILLFYYYPYSAEVVKQKELDWNAHITEQFMTSMDTFTRYVYNLPFELVQNREFRMYQAEEIDYQRVLIANEMKKYNATDAFIYNTLLYVKNIGYLFSKTGSAYMLEDMAKPGVGFYYENWPYEDLVETLDTLDATIVRPVEDVVIPGNNRMRMLTFLQPLPVGGSHSPGAVLIMVREDTILRMMKSVSETYRGEFFIFDGQGKPLVASNGSLYRSSDDLSRLVDGMGQTAGPVSGIHKINGVSYLVSATVSEKNGWKYVSMLPESATLQGIRTIQRNTALLVGLILLLEVIVIYVSIRKNYHPIKRLVEVATALFEPGASKPMNEIETIRYTLNGLSAANSRLDEEVKGTLPFMRDNVLLELVNGHFTAWSEFEREAVRAGIVLNGPMLTVAVFSCEAERGGETNRVLEFCKARESELPEGMRGYFFKSMYHHEIILVCSHEADVPAKAHLARLQDALQANIGEKTLVGIGSPAEARCPHGAHVSYLQALRTVEQLRLGGTSRILSFEEIEVSPSGTVSYFAELLQSLELSILKNEAAQVESLVERIIGYIGGEGLSPHMLRSVYLNTASVIFNGLQRFRDDDQRLLRLTDAAFQPRYTLEQMTGILRESSAKLCEMIRETLPASPRSADREDILAVLEAKCLDPNCSLQLMADHFGMSVSNFSHHFKKTVGQNFKETLDRLRIQKSAQLLRESEEALDAIAVQVGFTNTSSFIRTFKKIVGTTPGQYRQTHRS
ncbi:helix-turn-helix domain-containing protein [Paenibacillus sp. alder61]|uniref:AraC family transcriptional regulator n=1 Tax=Paenibacillus faecis TaxID=862114 RepID=A0A5D0CPW2_9BACL|nr:MULTISPECIES: helix-turn-helix domain-containing protein [Paenibacillus]MCA1292160.1 helix-turn-helix domain-containing protein [Paenibacillus sp. alder61]TYA11304.1 AraC family transcriptional regulator [Paenibacillus faecis]